MWIKAQIPKKPCLWGGHMEQYMYGHQNGHGGGTCHLSPVSAVQLFAPSSIVQFRPAVGWFTKLQGS